jgi:hypothetical protein
VRRATPPVLSLGEPVRGTCADNTRLPASVSIPTLGTEYLFVDEHATGAATTVAFVGGGFQGMAWDSTRNLLGYSTAELSSRPEPGVFRYAGTL